MSSLTFLRSLTPKLAAIYMAGAAIFSIAVAIVIILLNVSLARQVSANRAMATTVPAAGSLSGRRVADDGDWAPIEDSPDITVLFAVAEQGRVGDLNFWKDIAARTEKTAQIQYVGLCAKDVSCDDSTPSADRLILLKSMDPLQTYALVSGARRPDAFVFLGARSVGRMPIQADRSAFASTISSLAEATSKASVL